MNIREILLAVLDEQTPTRLVRQLSSISRECHTASGSKGRTQTGWACSTGCPDADALAGRSVTRACSPKCTGSCSASTAARWQRTEVDRTYCLAYVQAYASRATDKLTNDEPEAIMALERHVRLFRNGRNQAVRIPRQFELPGEDAIMRKEGERLIIEPVPKRSLLEVLSTLEPLSEDFPPIDDAAPDPVEL